MPMRTALLAFIAAGMMSAQAEVQIFNVWMSGNGSGGATNFYVIPTGKVYIIEGVLLASSFPEPTNTEIRVSVSADNMVANSFMIIPVSDTYADSQYTRLPEPFRLKAGDQLRVPNNVAEANYFVVRYFGLMIDKADLYAQAVPSELLDVDITGGQLLARVQYDSPRPRITTIESSTQLSTFTEDPTGVETPTTALDQSDVAVNTAGDVKFLRVSAVARNQ